MASEEYLRRPYKRFVIPDEEAGGFTAGIEEFPGCVVEGETEEEALAVLEEVALDWIDAELEAGRAIPEPSISQPPPARGRLTLRLPPDLHNEIAEWALKNDTSLNSAITIAVARFLGAEHARSPVRAELQESEWSATYRSQPSLVLRHVDYRGEREVYPETGASPYLNSTRLSTN